MKTPRGVLFGLAALVLALTSGDASGRYVEALFPLQKVINDSHFIAEGVFEKVNPKTRTAVLRVTRSLKGKVPYTHIKMNVGVGQVWHPQALMPHLANGAPGLMFYNNGKQGLCYINRFFCQFYGQSTQPPDKGWWTFTHVEIKMNRTYNRTVKELTQLVDAALRGKRRPPAPNPKLAPLTKSQILAIPKFGAPPPKPKPRGLVATSFQHGVTPSNGYAGSRDAWLAENQPDVNHGAVPTANVDGNDPNGTGHDAVALLRWDVSAIPPGSKVHAVRIELHVTDTSANAYPLFPIKQAWDERTVTWKNRSQGAAWQTPGAKGAQDRDAASIGAAQVAAPGPVTITLNGSGVSLVQSWINHPASNHGVILGHADFSDGLDFALREAAAAAQRPKLTVEYVRSAVKSSR